MVLAGQEADSHHLPIKIHPSKQTIQFPPPPPWKLRAVHIIDPNTQAHASTVTYRSTMPTIHRKWHHNLPGPDAPLC